MKKALKVVRTSMNPLVHYGFVKLIDLDNAEYDCRKLENILHETCHAMSWENLVAWKGKSEPPSIVPQVCDWQFWTELATQTIRKMHIKIPKTDYNAVVFGFSTVAWIMAQDYQKGGSHYEDGTPFLKKCMKDGVQTYLNMQQGFLSLVKD